MLNLVKTDVFFQNYRIEYIQEALYEVHFHLYILSSKYRHRPSDSYLMVLQNLSIKILSKALPFPSIETKTPLLNNTFVKSLDVNWLPWSVLKISGFSFLSSAVFNALKQKSVVKVFDISHDTIKRENQSTTAPHGRPR